MSGRTWLRRQRELEAQNRRRLLRTFALIMRQCAEFMTISDSDSVAIPERDVVVLVQPPEISWGD